MQKGDQFTIEWDIDGVLSEVDIEYSGNRLDTGKTYSLTKAAVKEMASKPWEETIEW